MTKQKEHSNASDKYQYLYNEINGFKDHVFNAFSNEFSLYQDSFSEEQYELKEQLKERIWQLAKENCSERQYQILILLYKEEKTQEEAAKVLKLNQSSIAKSLHGSTFFQDKLIRYGGSIKKLQKLAMEDEKIQNILLQLNDDIEIKEPDAKEDQ